MWKGHPGSNRWGVEISSGVESVGRRGVHREVERISVEEIR